MLKMVYSSSSSIISWRKEDKNTRTRISSNPHLVEMESRMMVEVDAEEEPEGN